MAKDELGRRICYKICSHISVHTRTARALNSSSVVAGSGPNTKRLIVNYGDVQNTQRPCIALFLVLRTIFDKTIMAASLKIR
jgi:hypothetical protein